MIAALREYRAADCRNVIPQMSGALVSKRLMDDNAHVLWTIARAMRRD